MVASLAWSEPLHGEEQAHERAVYGLLRVGNDITDGKADPGAMQEYLGYVEECRGYIERRLPCRRYNAESYALVVLLSFRWPSEVERETAELLGAYLRAGYARLNDQNDACGAGSYSEVFRPGATLLELAVRQGLAPQARALIQAGEDPALQPSWRFAHEQHQDMFELAQAFWGAGMRAEMVRGVMERQLGHAGSGVQPTPAPRNARLV